MLIIQDKKREEESHAIGLLTSFLLDLSMKNFIDFCLLIF